MSKKSIYLLLGFVMIFASCKKGEEDPFLSLSSRKARISGDWEMTSIDYSEARYVGGIQNGTIYSEVGDADHATGMELYYEDTTVYEKDFVAYTLQINKDGTWEKTIDYEIGVVFEDISDESFTTYKHHILFTQTGTWSFLNKVKNVYKNKERIYLSILNETTDYSGGEGIKTWPDGSTTTESNYPPGKDKTTFAEGEQTVIYEMIMLKSKEMKWERKSDSEINSNFGFGEYNQTFDLTETITWAAQ